MKLHVLLLSAALVVTLCTGCGGNDQPSPAAGSSSTGSAGTGSGDSGAGSGSTGGSSGGAPGSGSGGTGGTGNTTSALPGNPDANLPALVNAFAALPHSDPTAEASAMVAAAQALPDVQDAGLSNSTTVWILYKDGTAQTISTLPNDAPEDAIPTSMSPAPPIAAAKSQTPRNKDATLPSNGKAFVYSSLTSGYTKLQLADPIATIRDGLTAQGYQVDTSDFANPIALRNVKGAFVFYLDTHGGIGYITNPTTQERESVYEIAIPMQPTDDNIASLAVEIAAGEVGYFSVVQWYQRLDGSSDQRLANYMFISKYFVSNNMSFTDDSLVFINGCDLMDGSPEAKDMIATLHTAGATNIAGWTGIANAVEAADTGVFLFDRLLGTNAYYTTTPANRPFNLFSVQQDMHTKVRMAAAQDLAGGTLNLDQSHFVAQNLIPYDATLAFDYKTAAPPFALAPTISGVSLHNDSGSLTLYGDFGSTSQAPLVTIGGKQIDAVVTSGYLTITALPQSGDASGGAIQVQVGGARSNQVMLNQWNGIPVTMVTYNGDAVRTVTCNINMRAVFDPLRDVPDGQPGTAGITQENAVIQNGQCAFQATDPADSGTIPWYDYTQNPGGYAPPNAADASGFVTLDGKGGGTMTLSIEAGYVDSTIGFLDSSATTGDGHQFVADPVTQNLSAGSSTQYGGGGVLDTLSWAAAPAAFPPVKDRAQ
jgi:hypothetical protein